MVTCPACNGQKKIPVSQIGSVDHKKRQIEDLKNGGDGNVPREDSGVPPGLAVGPDGNLIADSPLCKATGKVTHKDATFYQTGQWDPNS